MEYILQTNKLCKNYGKHHILKELTMNIPKGSIYGFVGRNGAGKTTLIRIVCGLHNPSSGSYSLYGVNNKDSAILAERRKTGAVVETPSIYPDLDARENLRLQYKILGLAQDNMEDILKLVELIDTGKKKAKDFSLGMRQRLGIAFSLIGNPDFLVLDEPINGLDPQGIVEIRELLLKLNHERGITILISSHILDELSKLATHYGFIDNGTLIKEMSAEELHDSCRQSMKITVNDTKILQEVLTEKQLEFKILSETEAVIFSEIEITPLVLALHDKDCYVVTMSESNESLENYFMKLVGGVHHD
ncbi:MAG: ATP-binding cassette domain-containing protein [Ruminococcus sp.]|nr:ATP-binding cassette domain-containing protein [Ruminococcus sp.]